MLLFDGRLNERKEGGRAITAGQERGCFLCRHGRASSVTQILTGHLLCGWHHSRPRDTVTSLPLWHLHSSSEGK